MSISILSFDRLSLGCRNSQFVSFNQLYIRSSKGNQVFPEPFHGRCHIRERGLCTSALTSINCNGRSDHQKDFAQPSNGPFILEGSSMDEIYDSLVQRLLPAAIETQSDAKYIIGLAGLPGAGKSTVSNEVVHRLNTFCLEKADGMTPPIEPVDIAVAVPMDGFHLYRSQLDMMEDPKEAHLRRGAPWTFDPDRLLSHLATLRRRGYVYMPSFDHALGDPVEDDIFVSPLFGFFLRSPPKSLIILHNRLPHYLSRGALLTTSLCFFMTSWNMFLVFVRLLGDYFLRVCLLLLSLSSFYQFPSLCYEIFVAFVIPDHSQPKDLIRRYIAMQDALAVCATNEQPICWQSS